MARKERPKLTHSKCPIERDVVHLGNTIHKYVHTELKLVNIEPSWAEFARFTLAHTTVACLQSTEGRFKYKATINVNVRENNESYIEVSGKVKYIDGGHM